MDKNKQIEKNAIKPEQRNSDENKNENIIMTKDLIKLNNNISKDAFMDINNLNKLLSNKSNIFNEKIELLELINSGSSGVVYTGINRKKQKAKKYAFKFLFDKDSHNEINIHKKLKHKNIPNIIRIESNQDYEFIEMEYAELGNIQNLKSEGFKVKTLSESLILYITGGVLEALKYIHINNKIIHMDIKPQNILIDSLLMIKLTDFSVSIDYKSKKDFIDLPKDGTCLYMSPEVLKKKRILISEASKVDIYSLGVLLYNLAFNRYPYKLSRENIKDYYQIEKTIDENNFEFPKDSRHSKLFINFVSNCLNKDIKKRYNIYQAINDPWIKGYKILLDEKENIYKTKNFLISLQKDQYIDKIKFIDKY